MPDTIIEICDLWKKYELGVISTGRLAHDLNRWWHRLRGRPDPYLRIDQVGDNGTAIGNNELWALRGVSFAVKQGEVLGLIGRNGAGKSTLLKVLSRVTAPTRGEVRVRGRIASLLEVGTGFHPDLTGRENVYLNGAILGMTKEEIRGKFDEIVAFAELEKFIDTPVKRYSSGMYVRLAFAVAAHLEPEILIVDEVLAVGDAQFQKKCTGKMRDVAGQGRTVLFVSHQMPLISSMCQRAVLLEAGSVSLDGPAPQVVHQYYERLNRLQPSAARAPRPDALGRLLKAEVVGGAGAAQQSFHLDSPIRIRMHFEVLRAVPKPPFPNFHLFDSQGNYVFVSAPPKPNDTLAAPGTYVAECEIPPRLLNAGMFYVGVALTFTHAGIEVAFFEREALSFVVTEDWSKNVEESRHGYGGLIPGPIRPQLAWSVCPEKS